MCCGSVQLKLTPPAPALQLIYCEDSVSINLDMNHLTVETEDFFVSLLELAANDNFEGFKRAIECDLSCVDEIGLWYGRQKGGKQMVYEHRTPLMVAATYGSVDVIKLILSLSDADVNRSCGLDKSTALHCAASGGAVNAVDVVKLLLAAGADPNLIDANGHRPINVILVPPNLQGVKYTLEALLSGDGCLIECYTSVSIATSNLTSPPLSPSVNNASSLSSSDSPVKLKLIDATIITESEKKEYPVDPSLPDIKNSIYSTDEFRMYSFKVRPCSRAYSHDWTECPFVHPGENARRRDPRKFHYSCVPCPEFRKGACRRGDMCEYAHGVFECWLHPAQYRTRLCKDGTSCARRVCFFAHTVEELRPLYVTTGSVVPSPRSTTSSATAVDFAATMNLLPGSPLSVSVVSPSFTPPMSPSANGMSHSFTAWPQPNIPTLHIPGSNFQSSRLRSSLNVRDIPADNNSLLPDFDVQQQQQLLNELSGVTQPSLTKNQLNRSGRLTINPSNLDDLFSAEVSSPWYADQALASAVYSANHKSAVLNQFQQQQSILPAISANFSPKNVDHPFLQTFASGRMSPRNVEPISPMSSWMTISAQREKQQKQLHSLSSRELGSNSTAMVGSPVNSWSKWGSSNGKLNCNVNSDEFGILCRSSSSELDEGEEPDLSWVQSLVKESPSEIKEKTSMPVSTSVTASVLSSESLDVNSVDHAVGA